MSEPGICHMLSKRYSLPTGRYFLSSAFFSKLTLQNIISGKPSRVLKSWDPDTPPPPHRLESNLIAKVISKTKVIPNH